jgi:glycosyltransferase involved in cell wall biosynthesis
MDWETVSAIADCVKKNRIDVIHSHGYKSDLYTLVAGNLCRTPLVATCHNWTQDSVALRFYQLVDGLSLQYFDTVAAVSGGVADVLRRLGVPAQKITRIPNGVDVSAFSGASPTITEIRKRKGPVVGIVARLMPKKGHAELLRSAPRVLAEFPDTLFVFVGEGFLRRDLENMARSLGIAENTLFLGRRKDMPGVYASLDVIVLPSSNEGMPMSILEALAAKKPVIATPVGDVPRVIAHGQTGLLVKPQNVDDLSSAILQVLSQPELRYQLAAKGSSCVERNWSAESMAKQYATVYERVCAQRAAA